MNGQIWTVVPAVAGLVLGAAGLVVAIRANRRADAANRLSEESNEIAGAANRLSEGANQISERALELSERLSRDQIELQRQEVALAHQAEHSRRSANIHVIPTMKTSHGEFKLRVENRGPHHADRVAVSLHQNDQVLNVGQPTNLAPGKFTEFSGHRGNFFAGALENELDDLLRGQAEIVELRVTFTDGNGPQVRRKRLITGPGSRFDNRPWTIEDWPADG